MLRKKNPSNNLNCGSDFSKRMLLYSEIVKQGNSIIIQGGPFIREQVLNLFNNLPYLELGKLIDNQTGRILIHKLNKALRRSITVVYNYEFKIVEGQLTKMTEHFIQLKTTDMESRFEIGAQIWDELNREKVRIGDVIRIYKQFGLIRRVGRAVSIGNNVSDEKFIDIPSGECIKIEENTTALSLDEIDIINVGENSVNMIYSNINVDSLIQEEVDKMVDTWIREKKVTIKTTPLIISVDREYNIKDLEMILDLSKAKKVPIILLSESEIFIPGILTSKYLEPEKGDIFLMIEGLIREMKWAVESNVADLIKETALSLGITYTQELMAFTVSDGKITEKDFIKYRNIFKKEEVK